MPRRSLLVLAAALVLTACNKPAPSPSAAAPDTGAVDTVGAAGAPLTDSTAALTDSVAVADTMVTDTAVTGTADVAPADSANDSTTTN